MLVAYPFPGKGYRYPIWRGSGLFISSRRLAMPRIRYSVESSRAFLFYEPFIIMPGGRTASHDIMTPLTLSLFMNKTGFCRRFRLLTVMLSLLLSPCLYAYVSYDFNPLTMHEDETRPNSESFFICAFDGMFLEFSEDVYVNSSKINDIKIFENGSEVEDDLTLELVNNESSADLVLRVYSYGRILCGGPGIPYYYSVVFPQGLFGDKEWIDSKYAEGHCNPEIKYDAQGYGEPVPAVSDMMEGDYTLNIPSTGFSLRFEHNTSCPAGPDFIQYAASIERLDNKGFYIEYHQPLDYCVSGGYLFCNPDNDGLEYKNDDGSFAFFDYMREGDVGNPLLFIGDYDYLENVEMTIECSSAPTFSLRIVGVGKYNEPDTSPTDGPEKVMLSVALPGGCVTQLIPRDTDNEFYILPEHGWSINTCRLGAEEIGSSIDENGLVLINISEDTILSAVFKKEDSGIGAPCQNAIKIYTRDEGIEIVGKPLRESVIIYRADGIPIYSGEESHIDLPAGLYMAKIGSATFKFTTH